MKIILTLLCEQFQAHVRLEAMDLSVVFVIVIRLGCMLSSYISLFCVMSFGLFDCHREYCPEIVSQDEYNNAKKSKVWKAVIVFQ